MPFSTHKDQQQFDGLIELIKQNKSTEFDFYKEQWTADGKQIPTPTEWEDWGWDKPVMTVAHTIDHSAESGPQWFYYKWKSPNGLSILTPAFDKNGPVGLAIKIPKDTSPEDLSILFAAIDQNDDFAAQVVEMDFTDCTKLTQRVVFPKNLVRMQNLIMKQISTTSIYGFDGPYDPHDRYYGCVMFDTAKMEAPDLSVMPNLRKVNFTNTNLTQWPILPKSLVDYVQYGSSSIARLNLSSNALPNLRRAYFNGRCAHLTDAYAICLARMMLARPDVELHFENTWYSNIKDKNVSGTEEFINYELTHNLLDEHFNQIVEDSSYKNRVLVTEAELRESATNLYDMLVDAKDIKSQTVVTSYINKRLPDVIAQVEAKREKKRAHSDAPSSKRLSFM